MKNIIQLSTHVNNTEQVTDLNEKLDAEITKADKLEIENKKLSSGAASLQRERDALRHERDTLREALDELRCSTITAGTRSNPWFFLSSRFIWHMAG